MCGSGSGIELGLHGQEGCDTGAGVRSGLCWRRKGEGRGGGLKLEEEQARGLTMALVQPPPPFRPQILVCSTDPQMRHDTFLNLSVLI